MISCVLGKIQASLYVHLRIRIRKLLGVMKKLPRELSRGVNSRTAQVCGRFCRDRNRCRSDRHGGNPLRRAELPFLNAFESDDNRESKVVSYPRCSDRLDGKFLD